MYTHTHTPKRIQDNTCHAQHHIAVWWSSLMNLLIANHSHHQCVSSPQNSLVAFPAHSERVNICTHTPWPCCTYTTSIAICIINMGAGLGWLPVDRAISCRMLDHLLYRLLPSLTYNKKYINTESSWMHIAHRWITNQTIMEHFFILLRCHESPLPCNASSAVNAYLTRIEITGNFPEKSAETALFYCHST